MVVMSLRQLETNGNCLAENGTPYTRGSELTKHVN